MTTDNDDGDTLQVYTGALIRDMGQELETKVHPKVRNHGEGPY